MRRSRRWFASVVFLVSCGLAAVAGAANYGVFVEVETEEDLLDLYTSQQIDEDAFQTLRELLHEGVLLAEASRDELYRLPNLTYAEVDEILAYRKEVGRLHEPADLVAADVLNRRKLEALAPFLLIYGTKTAKKRGGRRAATGRVRYQTTFVAGDEEAPSMAIVGTAKAYEHLDLGLSGVMTRTRLGKNFYDPNRDALVAEGQSTQLHLPKYYAEWKTPKWHVIGGTYRIGFGQRLTFDTSSQYTPNGIHPDNNVYYSQSLTARCNQSTGELAVSPCAGAAGDKYMSPDYSWSERMRGVALGLRHVDLGVGWLQVYAFGSYQSHRLYQYETYNKVNCDDPTNDDDDACKSPSVYKKLSDPDADTSKFSYETLIDIYTDLILGGNVSWFLNDRTHIGFTGYRATVDWAVNNADMQLDFQEWSRLPYGGPFGAFGLDAAWGTGQLDVFVEAARSIDSQPAGGGWGALLRSTFATKQHEIEATARYYGRDFANPYARPIAAADEYDGLRARDETGLRLKYIGDFKKLQVSATTDMWMRKRLQDSDDEESKENNVLAGFAQLRLHYQATRWFKPGIFLEYADKDLSDTGRDNCYGTVGSSLSADEPTYCQGEKLQAALQLAFKPTSRISFSARYQHRFVDDGKSDFIDEFRQDNSMWLLATWRPLGELRLRGRASYVFEDTSNDAYLDKVFGAYAEASYLLDKTWWMKLRYQYLEFLDARDSTAARDPNPSHWVRLELEARF